MSVSGLTHGSVSKSYIHFLVPTIIGMISHSVYCMSDVFFISYGVGSTGLAALNIAMPIFTIFSSIGLLLGVGAATTISVFNGQQQYDDTNRVFTLAMALNLAIGILLSILCTVFVVPISKAFGANQELLPYVVDYMLPIGIGAFAYLLSSQMQVLVRADYNPKLVMIASTTGNVLNIVLDYVFVVLLKGGMRGAAVATSIGPLVSVGILALHFITKSNRVSFVRHFFSPQLLGRILANGAGTFILEFTSGMVIFLYNFVLLGLGGAGAVAIYSVISNIAYVGKGIFNGIAQAAQPLISTNFGAKLYQRVERANRCSALSSLVFAAVVYGVILLFPQEITTVFLADSPGLVESGAAATVIYFSSFVFTGVNTSMMYYFQSIEKPVFTTMIAVTRGIALIIVGLIVFPPFLQETGVWITLAFAEVATFLAFMPVRWRVKKQLGEGVKEEA